MKDIYNKELLLSYIMHLYGKYTDTIDDIVEIGYYNKCLALMIVDKYYNNISTRIVDKYGGYIMDSCLIIYYTYLDDYIKEKRNSLIKALI